ncbi:MAG: uracil-DNA glycosylase [Gemmatimonadales bacterium]
MNDAIRGWLMLQQDLGGDEILWDVPVDPAALVARSAVPTAPASPVAGTRARMPRDVADSRTESILASGPNDGVLAEASPATAIVSGEKVDWQKGAPPIPGPGISVTSSPLVAGTEWESLDEIAAIVHACQRCPLCRTRTHAVPGEGDARAGLFLVGEGPGESEDKSGRPFVGRAGELLDKMLAAIDIPRADAYIANVVKCRPPKNRVPLPDEREACLPYLRRQIELVQPRVLLALGGTAAETLLGVKTSLGQLRLKVHRWNGIPLIVTYHPAALLRNPNWKRPAWDDVRIARQLLDRRA